MRPDVTPAAPHLPAVLLPRIAALLCLWALLLGAGPAWGQDPAAPPPPAAPDAAAPGAPSSGGAAPEGAGAPPVGASDPAGDTYVDLYTMGAGEHLFSLFGHGALCVTSPIHPRGICYNYGTTDFSQVVKLVWDFLHGNVTFWVEGDDLRLMLRIYLAYDRTIYRQRLPLTQDQARELARRLAEDALPENREYRYHHFRDNCSTRLRDHIDAITGLLASDKQVGYGLSIRQMVQRWASGNDALVFLAEVILGRIVDPEASVWEAMFLPDVLRDEIEAKMGVKPEIVYARKGPLPVGSPRVGLYGMVLLGVVGGALTFGAMGARRWWARRGLFVLAAVLLVLPALVLDGLALVSDVPELTVNELMAVLLPTDILLAVLRPGALRVYARARLTLLAVVLALSVAGVMIQPLTGALVFVALPMLGILLGKRAAREQLPEAAAAAAPAA